MRASGRSSHQDTPGQAENGRHGGRPLRATHQRFDGAGAWLERGALLVLLLVVGMRPLLSETYESGEGLFGEYVREAGATTPVMTAGFDLAIWLAAVAVALAGMLRRKLAACPFRWTGVEVGWLLMVVAAGISTVTAASNKRLALNASVDWLTAGALAITLARLCRGRLQIALVLGVIAAAGAASTVKLAMQVGSEYRLTREDYEQNKAKLWRDVPLDDPRVLLYERRLATNLATGFLSHSNAEGSLLMVCAFAAVAAGGLTGVRAARWALLAGGVVMIAGIVLTGSKGAFLAAGCGASLFLIAHRMRGLMRADWRAGLAIFWATVLIAAAGVTALGVARGGLPGSSLAFRWNYWKVTATIVGEHPFTGVGALNFDRAYLPHKPIDFPEEIRDPHNFVLAILAQWGAPGLAGLLLAVAGASVIGARRCAGEMAVLEAERPAEDEPRAAVRRWIPGVIVGFVLLRLWVMSGMLATTSGQASVFVDLVQYGFVWAGVFAVVVMAGVAGGRPGGWSWRLAAMCGAGAFLLHNIVDFSLFVPGAAAVFAALCGVALSGGSGLQTAGSGFGVQGSAGGAARRLQSISVFAPWAALVVAGFGLLVTLTLVFAPVSRAGSALARARAATLEDARGYYLEAAAGDVFDPVPLSEMAERLSREPTPQRVDAAIAALDEAVRRDPREAGLYRWQAQFYDLRYRVTRAESDLRAAIAAAQKVIELYPQSPDEHLNLAVILDHARAMGEQERAAEARAEYQKALDLDAARPGLDEVRKWSTSRRALIEQAMNSVGVPASRSG